MTKKPLLANVVQENWNKQFSMIGSHMPEGAGNIDALLWEYTVAQALERMAKARTEAAHVKLVTEGILFDHKKHPRAPGISEQVAVGKFCAITLTTKQASKRFDAVKFVQRVKLMFPDKAKELSKLEADCTSYNAVPHTFMSQLIVKEE